MPQRVGSFLRKTRQKLRLGYKEKGKVSVSRYLQEFKEGDKVGLKIHSCVQFGRFFPRFHGLVGTVIGKKGSCYQVEIRDGGKDKKLFVHPIHLKKQE
ncbi:50S ribosomal protein L21e [Candidatus Woesearchaeota archaeon]|nr:50S ribosomal protein L21e [Candidatus Woesearchaeota archaeon]